MSEENQNAVVEYRPSQELVDMQHQSKMVAASGLYNDIKNAPMAFLRMQMGKELGLKPTLALRGLFPTKNGGVGFSAEILKTLVQLSGKWRWRVLQKDAKGCVLLWQEKNDDGTWEDLGKSSFTIEDAKTAGLLTKDNWRSYPEDLCFARSVTRGIRTYCPSVTGGLGAYTKEEIGAEEEESQSQYIPAKVVQKTSTPKKVEVIKANPVDDGEITDTMINDLCNKLKLDKVVYLREYGVAKFADLTQVQRKEFMSFLKKQAEEEVGKYVDQAY